MTTIQISQDLKTELQKRKMRESETYENIIWDLLEDTMAMSAQTRREINQSLEEARRGDVVSHDVMVRQLRQRQLRLRR